MAVLNAAHEKLMRDCPRAVVHMRAQLQSQRLSLVFGAGLSKSFGLPDWPTLIERIAADRAVQGEEILKRFSGKGSLPYKTELLFQHFRKRKARAASEHKIGSPEFENMTLAKWFETCKTHLYRHACGNFNDALEKHPYLPKYLPIIQETPITITYNFDDYLERALFAKKRTGDTTLGYEAVTNPWTQFRRRNAVIYHPHGMLPTQLMEFPRDRPVFSESAYAKLFLGALAGDFSFLLNHLSKNTCLIVGSSLEDEDLRNILVQSAQSNPGNPHYFVYFLKPGQSVLPAHADAIKRANFQVYNLITLFLNENEIAALADLLYSGFISDSDFADKVVESGSRAAYHFYLTGPLGVGKSTTATQLRNLTVLDEWTEPRLQLLAKPWDELTSSQQEKVDKWITNQFKVKNDRLRQVPFGICLVDRPPMDPLAFTPSKEKPAKAKLLLDTICCDGTWPIVDGTVIFLSGDPRELAARILATGRGGYTEDRLRKMETDLRSVYTGQGVKVVDTRGRSVAEVTRMVSELIHFEDCAPFNFAECLKTFKKG